MKKEDFKKGFRKAKAEDSKEGLIYYVERDDAPGEFSRTRIVGDDSHFKAAVKEGNVFTEDVKASAKKLETSSTSSTSSTSTTSSTTKK